ncbi:hypothetical protein JIP62_10540 [Brevundimonas vitis]|uniref:ASCH domain-containing protein n=1 Tax=Brevundimonas vitisensis TaxID=2800818 RepID=A0ABX7BK46_9CAUL|nr:hypothetical protein [Brevundimonas vitisensis]QQQ17770.1 hypothetical protein JIP62_10540 [Brevundimonas vitisensis]
MVAYSFKPGFIDDIRSKVKCQTIRLPRKRHARAGEALQLFTGPRMKPVRLGRAICAASRDVRLDFKTNVVTLDDFEVIAGTEELNAFAVRDGFRLPETFPSAIIKMEPWEYMARWWAMTHPGQTVFRGVLIDWGQSFEAAK